MFGLSGGEDHVEALAQLNIVPLSISYEWEPCDELKALELYAKASGQPYIKKPGEDFNSILSGIVQPKGRVHLSVCEPIAREELEALRELPTGLFNREVAALLDRRILGAYRLYPNNYIAADLLSGKREHSYSDQERDAFLAHIEEIAAKDYPQELRSILLHIYANPVIR